MHAFLTELRAAVFPDELFEDLFVSWPAFGARRRHRHRVMVLQALEGLSDRQAVRRLETRMEGGRRPGPDG